MPLAVAVGTIVVMALVAFAVLALSNRPTDSPNRVARALRLIACIATVAVAAVLVEPAWQDSGTFAVILVGIPVVCSLVVVGLTLAGRRTALATWSAAVVMLVWSLLTSLGLGLYFLGPAVLLVVAAAATGRDRQATKMSATS